MLRTISSIRKRMTSSLILCGVIAASLCQAIPLQAQEGLSTRSTLNADMEIMLEGKRYVTERVDPRSSHANHVDDQIQFLFWNSTDPVQFNLNIHKDVLAKGSGTYIIPEANFGKVMVDLNFYNSDREVTSKLNRRIVFTSGKIEIIEVTDHTLVVNFEGEGRGLREKDVRFPISGSVNIDY
jgi:hypothetical protein